MMRQKTMGEQVAELGAGLAILGLGAGIIGFVVILGVILFVPIFLLMRGFRGAEGEASEQVALRREAPESPQRLFGAPAHEQWLNAYDYWIYCLEDATNITFSETAEGSFLGALIVTTGPAFVFALPYSLLDGRTGIIPFWIVLGALALIGAFAGWKLTQPATMFPGDINGNLTMQRPEVESVSSDTEDEFAMSLGEEL